MLRHVDHDSTLRTLMRGFDSLTECMSNTEDEKWGTLFCYCSQHVTVHSTGWCTVGARLKIPIHATTLEEANREFERIRLISEGRWNEVRP